MIDNRLKALALAPYIGQVCNVKTDRFNGDYALSFEILHELTSSIKPIEIFVKLKQIKNILHNEAIECATIVNGGSLGIPSFRGAVVMRGENVVQIRWFGYESEEKLFTLYCSGKFYSGLASNFSLVTDFLREKGYDLPSQYLNGKTLLETGLSQGYSWEEILTKNA